MKDRMKIISIIILLSAAIIYSQQYTFEREFSVVGTVITSCENSDGSFYSLSSSNNFITVFCTNKFGRVLWSTSIQWRSFPEINNYLNTLAKTFDDGCIAGEEL